MFKNRLEAGYKLAKELEGFVNKKLFLISIARGGVPVAFAISQKLNVPIDVIIPCKIPIPWNPEAGFGAVTADGAIVLNEPMVASLELTPEEIQREVAKIKVEIERRNKEYRGNKPFPYLEGKTAVIIDDGLASGYTMLAAIESVKKHHPARVIVAVPAASNSAVRLVKSQVDELICLISQDKIAFAVADYYEEWTDLSDQEVIQYLKKAEKLQAGSS